MKNIENYRLILVGKAFKNIDELNEKEMGISKIIEKIEAKIEYPMFVKPSNSGSSVAVMKAENKEELVKAIENAKEFDKEVLVEQGINGKEVECAVLTVFPVDGKEYIALLPLDENGQNETGEVYLYSFSRTADGDPMLANIEDDEEYDAAANAFNAVVEKARADEESDAPLN